MAGKIRNERGQERDDLATAALDRGKEQLESAKDRWAEGAERVAAAVDRTADELEGDGGDGAISGFGHSVANLMRQLSGGLRERDVDDFARELGALARRNPGMFLAGSVALGFGVARFFKARRPDAAGAAAYENPDRGRPDGAWQVASGEATDATGARHDFDVEEELDLSAASQRRHEGDETQDGITSGGKS
jgi:hypothetical protein